MPFGLDDIFGAAKAFGPMVGGALGFMGSEDTNQANSAQSQAQMDFQREMSNTAYQRAVVDMKAAGLNPMLAYSQGGASSPGGAQATMQNSAAAGAAGAQAAASVDLTKATTEKTRAETVNTTAEAEARIADYTQRVLGGVSSAAHTDQMARRLRDANDHEIGRGDAQLVYQQGYRTRAEGDFTFNRNHPDYFENERNSQVAHARSLTARAILDELEQPYGRAQAGYWRDVGKGGVYVQEGGSILGRLASSAGSIGLRLPRR